MASEVARALRPVANAKSPGAGGLPMDFLKLAILTAEVDGETINILAAPLAILLAKMLASGVYPRE